MANQESVHLYLRKVNELHTNLILNSQALIRKIAGDDQNTKISATKELYENAKSLRDIISNNDIPSWLNQLIRHAQLYIDSQTPAHQLLENLILIKNHLEEQQWNFESNSSIDFDAIYDHFKNESRIPELFDRIISLLEQIDSSGEVDSNLMLASLGKLIATLKSNKSGSYFSINSTWEFLISFINNYLIMYLLQSSSPGEPVPP